jgi:hypothetical protein
LKPNNEITHKNINEFSAEKQAEWANVKPYDKTASKLPTTASQKSHGNKYMRRGGEHR